MAPEIIVALITSISTLIVAIVSIIMSNRLISFKVDDLTKKVEKHNNLVERIAVLERDNKTAFNQLAEVKEDINRVADRVAS